MTHTPCANAPSEISRSTRSSPAIYNEGGLRGARVVGSGAFRDEDDDGVAERRWIWLIDEATLRERKVKSR